MAGGACVAGGHVWQGGCAWWGMCVVGGVRGRGVNTRPPADTMRYGQ